MDELKELIYRAVKTVLESEAIYVEEINGLIGGFTVRYLRTLFMMVSRAIKPSCELKELTEPFLSVLEDFDVFVDKEKKEQFLLQAQEVITPDSDSVWVPVIPKNDLMSAQE